MSDPLFNFDAPAVLAWARLATAGLRAERARIDALNVFPVADSDTGTNLLLTFVDGATALESHLEEKENSDVDAGEALVVLARGALRGARGSSGTILSQILFGVATELADQRVIHRQDFARALRHAADSAWEAVSAPKSGTILSVVRAAADAATELEGAASAVVARTVAAARTALVETQNQLDVLRRAGVVDAGGTGLLVIFEALLATVAGREELPARSAVAAITASVTPTEQVSPELVPLTGPSELHEHLHGDAHLVDGEFEVMFLVDDDSPTAGRELRAKLQKIGASVVVVGGAGLWQVHVHCDDVLEALAVTPRHKRHQITVHHLPTLVAHEQRRDIGVVLCTRAPGLAGELARSGAVVVIMRDDETPSAQQLSRAIVDSAAREVVVLAAQSAARDVARKIVPPTGINVRVLDSVGEAYLLAAAAVHQPVRTAEHDPVAAILDAVARVSTFSAPGLGSAEREAVVQQLPHGELATAIITSPSLAPSADASRDRVKRALEELRDVSDLCEDLGVELDVLYGGQESPSVIWSVE